MFGSISIVDLLFVITIVLLVFTGFRNGFVLSLVGLISIPLALAVAWFFGPQLTSSLANSNINATPVIIYLILFFATVLIVHIVATVIRGFITTIPVVGGVVGLADTLLGGIIGFIEAWLLWVLILYVLHQVLQNGTNLPGVTSAQLSSWQDFYNNAITNSLFAKVNGFILGKIQR